MKSNIPPELRDVRSEPLKIDPQDPKTAELVKDFVSQKEGEEVGLNIDEEGGNKKPRIQVPADRTFDEGDPSQTFISEAFVPLKDVACTDMEKELFLKAVITDTPVRLAIVLYDGKLTIDIRSRTVYEQKRTFDAIEKDRQDGVYKPEELAIAVTRLQFYLASLMVERINGSLFSELTLSAGSSVDEDVTKLRTFVKANLEGMNQLRWNSILNALRIFEHKCAKLNTEAANEDFWRPHGSA